jgi:uncharacterized protein
MNAIGWIFRILLVLFVIRLALRFLARLTGPASSPGRPAPKPNQPATREGGQLVRDPNCGTYVPIGRALRQGSGDSAVYFCSDACRSAWATRKAG